MVNGWSFTLFKNSSVRIRDKKNRTKHAGKNQYDHKLNLLFHVERLVI